LASKFKGTDVIGSDNQKIGDVGDILFDKSGKFEAFGLAARDRQAANSSADDERKGLQPVRTRAAAACFSSLAFLLGRGELCSFPRSPPVCPAHVRFSAGFFYCRRRRALAQF
jgi:hypothetical protein